MGAEARAALKERGDWSSEKGRGFGGGAPTKFLETTPFTFALNATNALVLHQNCSRKYRKL